MVALIFALALPNDVGVGSSSRNVACWCQFKTFKSSWHQNLLATYPEVGQRPSEAMATTVVLDRGDLQIPESSPIGDPVPARGYKYGHIHGYWLLTVPVSLMVISFNYLNDFEC